MELVITLVLGFVVGFIVARIMRPKPIGSLRVDHSDPEGPYIFLELEKDLSHVAQKKEALLKVKIKDYISHE